MKLIGLTGGPGCGKSAVLKYFKASGLWTVFDADQICHEIYAEKHGCAAQAIAARWGGDFIREDGTPDRTKIAERVFADSSELAWLNALLHPMILRKIELGLEQCACSAPVMIDVPLLFETGWNSNVSCTIAVWSTPEIQMARLLARGWTRHHAEERIASQLPAHKKLELADYGIINNSTLEVLEEQCTALSEKLLR